ncbi:hypothetical protein N7478_001170 [Penicillium angulare]|uniref:uncharacterized protein n=1 Tax=Penicillium angulare TaxID=116970 RepID=UPI00253FC52E|nr:uncharacterized protein N7478_001170 [Penicillium angulare]KAJ5291919.1 hypothetical protein N7478_001170 [Penicillium angulare]
METTRRRQLHSCDPCRKGKRGCDAPKIRNENGFSSCSNCTRWNKDCTFNWLASKRVGAKEIRKESRKKTQPPASNPSRNSDIQSLAQSHGAELDEILRSTSSHPESLEGIFTFTNTPPEYAPTPYQPGNIPLEARSTSEWSDEQSTFFTWTSNIPFNGPMNTVTPGSNSSFSGVESETASDALSLLLEGDLNTLEVGNGDIILPTECEDTYEKKKSIQQYSSMAAQEAPWSFCVASDKAAKEYARSTMTRNLVRIYHDSMENALSCWLTEHNCPYGDSAGGIIPYKEKEAWAPNWSNRMCIRVCRLDRVASSVRGRTLSAEEDRTAARALHLAIMAFASQWTQHAQKGTGSSIPEAIDQDERSIREHVWNKARHALEHTTGIPSFRIIFANIIFSLTQCPLKNRQNQSLGQLLEADRAPIFLENANRQLCTFRHKLTRLQREATPLMQERRRQSVSSSMTDALGLSQSSDAQGVDPLLSNQEYRTTLSLMFWLGIMFDTLSSAMYQRPLVVSDEDSQISSASPAMFDPGSQFEFGGWNIPRKGIPEKQDVWGDFFLRHPVESGQSTQAQPRWPCSYDEAASVLSEATPVKVLLYRRVTQLQTLVYRGTPCDRLEEVIQKTISVYRYWRSKYEGFMLDCVANHELLPPRIQSWYVILDGHWHLAAMLLADVIEGIDRGGLGSGFERETREATNFVSTLRIDNAFAVGGLARSSLHGREPTMYRHFHDSLNEVAFLVEPWTVVLIHSFAKAGYISLENLDASGKYATLTESLRENCNFCIRALEYLGRKSDMATVVAGTLSSSLEARFTPENDNYGSRILTPSSLSPDMALFNEQLTGNINLLVSQ